MDACENARLTKVCGSSDSAINNVRLDVMLPAMSHSILKGAMGSEGGVPGEKQSASQQRLTLLEGTCATTSHPSFDIE